MADTQGQQDLRGIDIQEFVTGFADEDIVLKKYCRLSKTANREIRWFVKTAGYVSPATTTGITSNLLANTASGAIMPVAYQSWTRQTSYIRNYKVESELISMEDEKDCDVDVLMVMIRDLLTAVASQVDTRIFNVLTENLSPSNIQTAAATGTGWDDAINGNPILDLLNAKQLIRSYRYNPENAICYINSIEHKNLVNWIISVKGSSIPGLSSEKARSGVVMELAGLNFVVSENATTDYATVFIPKKSVAWKSFMPLTSEVERYAGKGKKIFVWEEGEAILENPKSVVLITDTVT